MQAARDIRTAKAMTRMGRGYRASRAAHQRAPRKVVAPRPPPRAQLEPPAGHDEHERAAVDVDRDDPLRVDGVAGQGAEGVREREEWGHGALIRGTERRLRVEGVDYELTDCAGLTRPQPVGVA
jgi:hypothetical protein